MYRKYNIFSVYSNRHDSGVNHASPEFVSEFSNCSLLLRLQHLTYIDFNFNYFSILPKFIGSLTKLQYHLTDNVIFGTIPLRLGNLSSLISLDLNLNNGLNEDHNLDWLIYLSSLRHLDMSNVNLNKVANWSKENNKSII